MLRIQAEFDNFKKRTQKERQNERKYKSQDLVNELLPVLDNFERALEVEVVEEAKSIVEGISMVYRQLKDALESRSEEHTSELQSRGQLVCRLLLEKKKPLAIMPLPIWPTQIITLS